MRWGNKKMSYYERRFPIGCAYCEKRKTCKFIKEKKIKNCKQRDINLQRFGYKNRDREAKG